MLGLLIMMRALNFSNFLSSFVIFSLFFSTFLIYCLSKSRCLAFRRVTPPSPSPRRAHSHFRPPHLPHKLPSLLFLSVPALLPQSHTNALFTSTTAPTSSPSPSAHPPLRPPSTSNSTPAPQISGSLPPNAHPPPAPATPLPDRTTPHRRPLRRTQTYRSV
jgi:hypothetical protein